MAAGRLWSTCGAGYLVIVTCDPDDHDVMIALWLIFRCLRVARCITPPPLRLPRSWVHLPQANYSLPVSAHCLYFSVCLLLCGYLSDYLSLFVCMPVSVCVAVCAVWSVWLCDNVIALWIVCDCLCVRVFVSVCLSSIQPAILRSWPIWLPVGLSVIIQIISVALLLYPRLGLALSGREQWRSYTAE